MGGHGDIIGVCLKSPDSLLGGAVRVSVDPVVFDKHAGRRIFFCIFMCGTGGFLAGGLHFHSSTVIIKLTFNGFGRIPAVGWVVNTVNLGNLVPAAILINSIGSVYIMLLSGFIPVLNMFHNPFTDIHGFRCRGGDIGRGIGFYTACGQLILVNNIPVLVCNDLFFRDNTVTKGSGIKSAANLMLIAVLISIGLFFKCGDGKPELIGFKAGVSSVCNAVLTYGNHVLVSKLAVI